MSHPPVNAAELEREIIDALGEADRMLRERQYFETHEVLERVWLHCRGNEKAALGGLILLASALHKSRRQGNPRAARQIYARALTRLAPLADVYRGIDLRAMERATLAALYDHAMDTPLIHARERP